MLRYFFIQRWFFEKPIIVKTIPIGSKGNPKIKLFRYAVPPIILNTPIKLVDPIVNQNNLPVTLKV